MAVQPGLCRIGRKPQRQVFSRILRIMAFCVALETHLEISWEIMDLDFGISAGDVPAQQNRNYGFQSI